MAAVYLLSAASSEPSPHPKALLDLEQMEASARLDRFGAHQLVEDPREAEVIIFVETSTAAGPYYERVRQHPVYRQYRALSYLFSSTDRCVPFLPGVYACIERRWYWPSWTRSGHYLGVREGPGRIYDPARSSSLLFSFVGSGNSHPVRRRILRLKHQDALILEAPRRMGSDLATPRFVDAVLDSAFVLCPRGLGTSSFRLFETMMLGRVPVIISDEWVPPEGPDWASFSVRVGEADVDLIPEKLEARAGSAREMGDAARAAWVDWFSERVSFHRTVELCLDLADRRGDRAGLRAYAPYAQMLRPYHAARWLAWQRPGRRLGRAH